MGTMGMESHTCDVCLQTIWRIVLMTEKVQYPDLVVVGAGLFGLTVASRPSSISA